MGKYIVKRVLQFIPVFLGVTLILFALQNIVPGDPIKLIGGDKALSPEVELQLRVRYHLVQTDEDGNAILDENGDPVQTSLVDRYLYYMNGLLHGDLGNSTAYAARIMRSQLLDVMNQDYIRTARAKGVPGWKVIFKHALRNALIPVITYVGPMVAYILTGSMVVENIFTIGGLGSSFVTSITNRDYTMIMATTIFLAILMVVANLLTDIAYKFVDPRITFE